MRQGAFGHGLHRIVLFVLQSINSLKSKQKSGECLCSMGLQGQSGQRPSEPTDWPDKM
jgi:hypothetical protein